LHKPIKEHMTTPQITLTGPQLHLSDVSLVANGSATIVVHEDVWTRMGKARVYVDEIASGDDPVYGVNTGFGALAEVRVEKNQVTLLQHNLIESHAVGVGDPMDTKTARALMLLRANTLAVGHSGCRAVILDHLVQLLNAGCAPFVPSKGSVGASGDLAPLAHVALLLIGKGKAYIGDELTTAQAALEHTGIEPLVLKAKEGLALINGTQAMAATGVLAVLEAQRLCQFADLIGGLSLDALKGTARAFDSRIHASRPHPGQIQVASNLHVLLRDSEIMDSHSDCSKVQDPYSLRCMPQVHGATRDAISHIRDILEREICSATDNPLVFLDGDYGVSGKDIISGGNFHGQPIAMGLDYLAIAVAELANIAERRIEQLVNPHLSSGLPPFLSTQPGLNSGFMILQVTAASLINENKVLCHPASVDSIPSSANREDHVSMGMTSANKALSIIDNVRTVLAIELLCSCQAIDMRDGLHTGKALQLVHDRVRERISFAPIDREFYIDLMEAIDLLKDDLLLETARHACGHPL
jgi:histidine ammonia-lyase